MKVSHKVALLASCIIVVTFAAYSWLQYHSVRDTLMEKTQQSTEDAARVMSFQITNWLNSKLRLIDMMAQAIDADFNASTIQSTFDIPLLKDEFILIFGGLDTDGKKITNDTSWNPKDWDARKRPWYPYAKSHKRAVLTDPYADAATNEILISAVANFYDKGVFKGAFGGDLSLKTVSDALNTLNFHDTGYAFLVNANGNIISHPNDKLNGKQIDRLFDGNAPELTGNFQEAKSGAVTVLASFYKLQNLYGSDWLIGVVLDKRKVMAEANDLGMMAVIATIISALICSTALYMAVTRQLLPLKHLYDSLLEINSGDGDLTKRLPIESKDEFGKVSGEFNQFLDYLQELIKQIKQISQDVRSNSDMSACSAQDASNNLSVQLHELDQLATAMHQMSATAGEVAQNAQGAADAVQQADNATSDGGHIVEKTTHSVAELAEDMDKVVSIIGELSTYSDNIASILTVITDIADQTNLLALNAAIEAARAGEMGRGFAVVADEVRALASRTQESTEEIQSMINQLQSCVKKAEATITASREKAHDTQQVSSQANEALESIRASIFNISQMTVQIATAAEQQSATAEEINRNTSNIRDISQSVADGAHEQANHCQTMANLTAQQDSELSKFKV